jgi:hypothetical protein
MITKTKRGGRENCAAADSTHASFMERYFSTGTVVMLVIYDSHRNMDNGPSKLNQQTIENSKCAKAGKDAVVVGPLDVLLGRGKSNETHLGNIKFRSKFLLYNVEISNKIISYICEVCVV